MRASSSESSEVRKMVEIKELLDLDKTIAKELFDGKTYPWEVLDGIKDFILKLGPTLDANEFDNPSEGVWVAKDAKVFPSADRKSVV